MTITTSTHEFHEFKEYTPAEYLMIDIATNFGDIELSNGDIIDLDKENFEDRIAWFKQHEKDGTLVDMLEYADKPALYFAGLKAYDKYLAGEPTGYMVSFDACSSGLQILAALSNCEKSAKYCGVINTGKRENAYTALFQVMKDNADSISLRASADDMKQAVMTSLYGSKAQPRILFGEGTPALDLYYQTVETEIPGAWELNKALKDLWIPYAESHEWVLPDNFHVSMAVEALDVQEVLFLGEPVEVFTKQPKGTPTGLSLSPNIVHSIDGMIVREVTRRCNYNPRKVEIALNACRASLSKLTSQRRKSMMSKKRKKDKLLLELWKRYLKSGFLSARMIELIDQKNVGLVSASLIKNMIEQMPKKPFQGLTIHDCFKMHPNYATDVRRQFNYVMSDIAASDMMSDIATQITGQKQKLIKKGNISKDILNANYALS